MDMRKNLWFSMFFENSIDIPGDILTFLKISSSFFYLLLRNFSSMDTLSEVSDLPRNQPLKASKTRLDLYNSPIKRRYDKPVQTKPNLLGAASAHRLNVSETSQCGSSPISSRMDSEKRNKVKFKEIDEADNNVKASAGDAKVTLSGMSKWKYPR